MAPSRVAQGGRYSTNPYPNPYLNPNSSPNSNPNPNPLTLTLSRRALLAARQQLAAAMAEKNLASLEAAIYFTYYSTIYSKLLDVFYLLYLLTLLTTQ